jgi:putative transposase
MAVDPLTIPERGVLTLSEQAWAEAHRRALVIAPLAARSVVDQHTADEAAAQLGLSRRQIYNLLHRFRHGDGLVTDLAPGRSHGGKGRGRLDPAVEAILRATLQEFYLARPKRSEAALTREVARRCRQAGIRPPARNTIRARIERLDPVVVVRRREGNQAARTRESAAGVAPQPQRPLDLVQIDHTPIDLIVVDELARQPIGRPYLTIAIDVFSRCVVGMIVTLEAPSATSVGLCLAHAVTDKRPWLERLGIECGWPMTGKPGAIHMDNAPEFHSEALRRGCQQYGIARHYRPPGEPHFGGVIERLIGTAMRMIHELPGTTFSNAQERGSYDSEASATLTLTELERWLALAIAGSYHQTVHGTLKEPPASRWADGVARHGAPVTVSNPKAFLIDFLPVIRRTIQRTGFVIDHVAYYSDALKPWIARRDRLGRFVIRRDPRDLSRVWVLDPEESCYVEVPYRTLSHPAVTLWEHRRAVAQLRERGRARVDEAAVFRVIEQMRALIATAARERQRARRDGARRAHLPAAAPPPRHEVPEVSNQTGVAARPFDEIEEW